MRRLRAVLTKLIRLVAEDPIRLHREEVVELLPHVLLDWDRMV